MKTRVYQPIIACSCLCLLLVACAPQRLEPTPTTAVENDAITLSVSGSGSITPVLTAITDEFEADTPGYILDVLPGSGSGGGARGVADGTLDLAAMSRPPRDNETEGSVSFVQVGTSVTAIMAHPDVGVTDLTSEQLAGILFGEITNWSEVDGTNVDVVVYVRDPEEGNTVDIRETYIGDAEFAENAQIMTSQTDLQNAVASVEGAIGYGTWAAAIANEADLIALTIDGVGVEDAPDSVTTMVGIGFLQERAEDVQPFIDWLKSDSGQAALESVTVRPIVSE